MEIKVASDRELVYAQLAANVYGQANADGAQNEVRSRQNTIPVPAGWTVIATRDTRDLGPDQDTGFLAAAYTNGTEIIISYAGTTAESDLDWWKGNVPAATATVVRRAYADSAHADHQAA